MSNLLLRRHHDTGIRNQARGPVNQTIYLAVLAAEGIEDENVPGDHGGETFCGIDAASNPNWPGWIQVHADVAASKDPTANASTMAMVQAFYANLWAEWDIDYLPEILQGPVFGGAVNMGSNRIVTWLQQAVCDLGQTVTIDGCMGPVTLAAISKIPSPDALADKLWILRAKFYVAIVNKDPTQAKFLRGWLNRLIAGL